MYIAPINKIDLLLFQLFYQNKTFTESNKTILLSEVRQKSKLKCMQMVHGNNVFMQLYLRLGSFMLKYFKPRDNYFFTCALMNRFFPTVFACSYFQFLNSFGFYFFYYLFLHVYKCGSLTIVLEMEVPIYVYCWHFSWSLRSVPTSSFALECVRKM